MGSKASRHKALSRSFGNPSVLYDNDAGGSLPSENIGGCDEALASYSADNQAERQIKLKELQDYIARTDCCMTTFLDEFECGRELGSGQFATVYLAVHLKTNVPCAIKVLRKKEDGGEGELFKMEAEVCRNLQKIQHPHITRIIDVLDDETNFYIVMEVVLDGILPEYTDEIKNTTIEEREVMAQRVMHQVLSAVVKLNSMGIVHRDIKLSNILIEKTDSDDINVKLCDFGFSTFIERDSLTRELKIGTEEYMAPEII